MEKPKYRMTISLKEKEKPLNSDKHPKEQNQEPVKIKKEPIEKTPSFSHWQTLESKIKKKGAYFDSISNPFLRKNDKKRKNTLEVILSVCGALMIGVIMGLSILSLFFSSHTQNQQSSTIDAHLPNGKKTAVHLPTLDIVMLQAASFKDEERARKGAHELELRGLSPIIWEDSPSYHVFVGLASNKYDAKSVSLLYEKKNVDVYLKEIHMRGPVSLSRQEENLKEVIAKGNAIFSQLLHASSLNASAMKQFDKECKRVTPLLIPSVQKKLSGMKKALYDAEEGSSKENVQLSLMRYALHYNEMLRILK